MKKFFVIFGIALIGIVAFLGTQTAIAAHSVVDEATDTPTPYTYIKTNMLKSIEAEDETRTLSSLLSGPVLTASSTVSTAQELIDAVSTASDGDIITLSPTFSLSANLSIPTPGAGVSITVDGNGFDFGARNLFIADGPGAITFKNLSFGTASGNTSAITIQSKGSVFLENVTIDGRATTENGGAIFIWGFSLSGKVYISNCTISNNSSNGSGYSGGAIYMGGHTGVVSIANTVFLQNKTTAVGSQNIGGQGGALFVTGIPSGGEIAIKECYFEGNEAVKNIASQAGDTSIADGGAIAFFNIRSGSQVTVEGSTFYKNVAGADAGAMLIQFEESVARGTVKVTNNTFFQNESLTHNNSSANSGGAIQLYQTGTAKTSNIDLAYNTFAGNKTATRGGALASSFGGAFSSVRAYLTNNIFVDNTGGAANYNNVGVGSLTSVGGNIGVDNGVTLTPLSPTKVFGAYGLGLYANQSPVKAGATSSMFRTSAISVPTLPIMPTGAADGTAIITALTTTDQRTYLRSAITPDVGSVEIAYFEIDKNEGTWDVNQTSFDGTYYFDEDTQAYYQIGHRGQEYTTVKPPDLTRDGYTFEGFNSNADGTGIAYPVGDPIELGTLDRVYAIWRANTYSLTYNGNGSTTGTVPVDVTEYSAGENATVLAPGTLAKSGFVFAEWNTVGDGSGTVYQAGDPIEMNADITLYAVWKKSDTDNGNNGGNNGGGNSNSGGSGNGSGTTDGTEDAGKGTGGKDADGDHRTNKKERGSGSPSTGDTKTSSAVLLFAGFLFSGACIVRITYRQGQSRG